MPETTVIAVEAAGLPEGYTLSANEEIQPLSISASFDGSGAAGSFLPAIAIYAQSGRLLSRTFPGSSVAAGDSAEVTFAPFLDESASGAGIQFDFDNEGGWLYVAANDAAESGGSIFGYAIDLRDFTADGGIRLKTLAALGPGGGDAMLLESSGPMRLHTFSDALRLVSDSLDIAAGDPALSLTATNGGILVESSEPGAAVDVDASGLAALLRLSAHGAVTLTSENDSVTIVTGSNRLILSGLPNADPGVSGAVWNNAGVLNISP